MFKKALVFLKCLVLINVLFTGFSLKANAATGPKNIVEKTLNYQCSLKLSEQFILNSPATVTVNTTVPEWVDPYEHFFVNINSVSVEFPYTIPNILRNLLGWQQVNGNFESFPIVSDNYNYTVDIGNSLHFQQTLVNPTDELSLTVNKLAIAGPFPAGNQGINNLSIGNIAFKLQGVTVGMNITISVNCEQADNNSIFASILIN